jgi:hypothetical protein
MAQNKIEAVLSFKLDDKGLKDAEKELAALEKQLEDLNKQQAKNGPGRGDPEVARQITSTQQAIKLNKLQSGDPAAAEEFQQALEKRLGGREPSKTFTDNFEKAVTGALKDLFGSVATPEAKQRIVDALTEAIPTKERPATLETEAAATKRAARQATSPLAAQATPIPPPPPEEPYKSTVTSEALAAAPPSPEEEPAPARRAVEPGIQEVNPQLNAALAEAAPLTAQLNAVDTLPAVQPERQERRRGRQGPKGAGERSRLADRLRAEQDDIDANRQATDLRYLGEPRPYRRFISRNKPEVLGPPSPRKMPVGARLLSEQLMDVGATVPADFKTMQNRPGHLAGAQVPSSFMTRGGGTTAPPPEHYVPPSQMGPEDFLVNPAEPKAKLDPKAKAQRDLANNLVKGALSDQAEIDKNNVKINKDQASSLEKEVKARKGLATQAEAANKLMDRVRDASLRFNLLEGAERSPEETQRFTGGLRQAYKAQQEVQKNASALNQPQVAQGAVSSLRELDKAALQLKDSVIGTNKSFGTFENTLKAVDKKSSLLQERDSLLKGIKAEPDRDMRRNYAHALNLNTQQLQEFETDPTKKRALNKENVARNREYGLQSDMMASFGQFLAGNVLLQTSRSMRAPFAGANQAFDAFNQQHQVDPVLLNSQRANQAAMLGLGEQFQGYNLFKNSLAHAALTNPIAPAAAVVGDVAGAIAGPAGSMLQTGASLKMAAVDNKALSTALSLGSGAGVLGLAGLAGAGVGVGLGALLTNLGSQKKDPFETLRSYFDPQGVASDKTQQRYGTYISKMSGTKLTQVSGLVDEAQKNINALDYTPTTAPKSADEIQSRQRTKDDALKNLGDIAEKISQLTDGKGLTDELKKSPDLLKGFIKAFQESLFKSGSAAITKFQQIIDNDPVFKLQQKQMREQRSDQAVDFGRSRQQLELGYSRQTEDITKNQTRTKEDYSVNLQRLGVSRARAAEDFTLANQQNDLQIFRTRRQTATQLQRLDEDQTRQRFRLAQDDSKQRLRLEEDTTRQTTRLHEDVARSYTRTVQAVALQLSRTQEDTARSWQRAVEDSTRTATRTVEDSTKTMTRTVEDAQKTMTRAFEDAQVTRTRLVADTNTSRGRLIEDASISRSRLSEDYNTTVQNQNRNYVRSNQDLDQGYTDSVLGIVAPGLGSNPAYQLMKLNRDYTKNKSRLGEDYQTNRSELNRNTDRSFDDIARSVARSLDDLQKSFDRTMQDLSKSLARTTEDVNTTLSRTAEDISLTLSRTAEDLAQNMSRLSEDIATTLARAGEDAAKTLQQASEDASTALVRGMEDINTNLTRTLDDLNLNLARATQDMDIEAFRARFDAQLALADAEIDYQTNRNKIQLDYNRQVEDLNNAEFDLKRNFNRQLDDLNIAQQRATQDYKFASDGLNIAIQRADRDFENASQSFVLSVAQAAGLISSFNQQIASQMATGSGAGAGSGIGGVIPGIGGAIGGATPGLGGINDVPRDEFDAKLHVNEMVVTKDESKFLRSAGYRPESQNLREVLPELARRAAPRFAGGFNGFDSQEAFYAANPTLRPGAGGGNPAGDPDWSQMSGWQQYNYVDPNQFYAPTGTDAQGYTTWQQQDPNSVRQIAGSANAYWAAHPGLAGLNPGAIGPNYAYNNGGNIRGAASSYTGRLSGAGLAVGVNPGLYSGIDSGSTNSRISTSQPLTNGSTRGIISATSAGIVPPAAAGPGSLSSARYGNVAVSVSITGTSSSRLQQILNQNSLAFARNLAAANLQIV